MSSRKTHDFVGGLSGGAYAAVRIPAGQAPLNNIAEILGGIVGGLAGSHLPDVIEPAIHSHHRSTFHSITVAGGVGTLGLSKATDIAQWCRTQADACRQRAEAISGPNTNFIEEFFLRLLELLLHFGAGAVNGAPAGYVSHLACDFTTPRSIPLVTRGF
ncbi:metal-dependent hydrolase [Corallococcus exiguus]|uniref:metal-dependent hydrolase n=1 Tax=Corallococcus exiguus TaxID=83462 RepID=UPI0015616FA5|nr:hypothetical protein [Corallococcus exiguus]NRD45958.1 hypothetical protein [Corallococcus exiguus]